MAEMKPHEAWSVVATIDPDNYAASTYKSDAWDMQDFRKAMVICMSGAVAAGGSVDWKLRESATSNGTYTTQTGKGVTAHTTTITDSQSIILVEDAELAATTVTGARWCDLHMTVAGTTVFAAAVVLGLKSRYKLPYTSAGYKDLSTVYEIID